jgi:hypothetical protein
LGTTGQINAFAAQNVLDRFHRDFVQTDFCLLEFTMGYAFGEHTHHEEQDEIADSDERVVKIVVPSRNPACVEFRNGTVLLYQLAFVLLHQLPENSKNY